MKSMIKRGPQTVVLVFTRTCPHCVSYMPIWDKLCNTSGRKSNMISMEASTYQKTPMSAVKPVSGVPTVLFVDKRGQIVEAPAPRDTEIMTNSIRGSSSSFSSSEPVSSSSFSSSEPVSSSSFSSTEPTSSSAEPTLSSNPYTSTSINPLRPIPAMPVQMGGNPWTAFMLAARQAAPAAALLGAYSMLPTRSSGLLAPRTRKHRKAS
jgi:hypothetical protein